MAEELQKVQDGEVQHQQRQGSSLPATSMQDMQKAGELLAQANYLGTRSPGEGFLVMAACQQRGEDLVSFQQRFHLRQGRFSMQAHEMLAELVRRGGGYKLLERSPEKASIKVWFRENEYTCTLTWEDAQQEPFVYAGNEADQLAQLDLPWDKRKLKNKYKTPRSRQQMLWARVVSDSVVVVAPEVRGGIYTPEETDDFMGAQSTASASEEEVSATEAAQAVDVEQSEAKAPEQKQEEQKQEQQQQQQKDQKKTQGKKKPGRPPKNKQKQQEQKQDGQSQTQDQTQHAGEQNGQQDASGDGQEGETQSGEQGPDPWEKADEGTDFTVCPIGDERSYGVKWADMQTDWLKQAHKNAGKLKLEQGHIDEIELLLKERGVI